LEVLEDRTTPAVLNVAASDVAPLIQNHGLLQNNGDLTPTLLLQAGSPAGLGPMKVSGVPPTSPPPGSSPPSSSPPSSPPASPPPSLPSLFQALISLYIDGIELEATLQGNIEGFKATPQSLTIAGELEQVIEFFGNGNLDEIQASIAFNEQFAGPFVVLAGQEVIDNAIQQQSASS
jgi:hypothetical protein